MVVAVAAAMAGPVYPYPADGGIVEDADSAQRCVQFTRTFFALSVSDIDRLQSWYATTLDVTIDRSFDLGARGRIAILSNECLTVELIERPASIDPGTELPGISHDADVQGIFKVAVFVSDIDAFHRKLADAGHDIDGDVSEDASGTRFFVIKDPDGNRIQFFQR